MRLITDTFDYCSRVVPKWNPISISGYHIREAGSTAAQEIAFTLGDGIAYVDAAVKRGLDVDSVAGRLSCFFNVHINFVEAVEALTDELEGRAEAYLRKIDEMGGMVEAISRGYPQREIEDAAFIAQREIEEKKQVVVGVNDFVVAGEPPFEMLRVDPRLEEQ